MAFPGTASSSIQDRPAPNPSAARPQRHLLRREDRLSLSQTVRTAGLAEQAGYDAAKRSRDRKRFLLVDTLGHVLGVAVLPTDVPERAGAKELFEEVLTIPTWLQRLCVDGS